MQPQTGTPDPQNLHLDAWLLDVAKGHVAEGVFARELTATHDVGDEQDRANFETICDFVLARTPNATIDRDGLWILAQETVKKDLRSPAFKKEAWEKANELLLRLFGQK